MTSITVEIGLAAASLIPLGVVVWQTRVMRQTIVALEGKLARQADALALLTETSESGFSAIAQELARREVVPATPTPPREPSTRRMTSAARRGKSVKEIAAAEQVSQGEVHLRLALAKHAAADRGAQQR
jgi:hypothetical protein